MNRITQILPYYNSAGMLRAQLLNWMVLPKEILDHLLVILIDDGSPRCPALPVIKEVGPLKSLNLRLYRVTVDIPWNQHGAKNLGAKEAPDGWMFMSDIDHMLPYDSISGLMRTKLDPTKFYTLQRVTAVKKEDGNLKYDLMTDIHGKPKPHPNTFLLTRKLFWETGGYDEDYCGTYGGDGPFVRMLEKVSAGRVHFQDLDLVRWTRDQIPDASQEPEFREAYKAQYRKLFDEKGRKGTRDIKPVNPIRFPWERLL